MNQQAKILYTLTDEAPALATRSLLPILRAYLGQAGLQIESRDISLAGRVLAAFPERLTTEQRVHDALTELGALVKRPEANVIKLPNISASIPQLKATIAELQAAGYDLPDYPDDPESEAEREIQTRYDRVKGSAVNPVLREGNSDRRAPAPVKAYARQHPHSMGEWTGDSRTRVAHMRSGDFRSSERSTVVERDGALSIEHLADDGAVTVLKSDIAVSAGDVIDAAKMERRALDEFLAEAIDAAREEGLLFSLHLKATMMKVSDPILFGHALKAYFGPVFETNAETFERLGVDANEGLASLHAELGALEAGQREAIEADLRAAIERGPDLAMVDSDRGITNLHVPSDVIVDASMPAMIRAGGKMWNAAGKTQDTLAVIPDGSYAPIYQAVIEDCQAQGAFDPRTMGTVPNVGLMAQKAEEYGSHDKTFEIGTAGRVRVVDAEGQVLLEHAVAPGDIWRMCRATDAAIRDWVGLAVRRARASGMPAVFWLDEDRAHDAQLRAKVARYLADHDTEGLDIRVLPLAEATRLTLERLRAGQDTISVTGNVLRDYLTDLFPILELGTSAKMLSIVPLMQGGGLFETGAGGSAPKHVQQLTGENHLRWDSLGEFLALAASLEHLAEQTGEPRASLLGSTLDAATTRYLEEARSPSRKVGELDNRGSHFYLAMYWAEALASQDQDSELAGRFAPLAERLRSSEARILSELEAVQGRPVDLGGYYHTDPERVERVMRPSASFNEALASLD